MEEDANADIRRLERKVDDLVRLSRENNKMLRGERAIRRLKGFVIILLLVFGSGYMYYLLNLYQAQIFEFQDRAQDLLMEGQSVIVTVERLKESLDSTQSSVEKIFDTYQSEE